MQTTVAVSFDRTHTVPETPSRMQAFGHSIAALVADEWDTIRGIALIIAGGVFATVQIVKFIQ